MAHFHIDTPGGAAGDMFIAAMLDAVPELEARVMADIAAILPAEAGRAERRAVMKGGFACSSFRLIAPEGGEDHHHHHHHETGTFERFCARIRGAALSAGTAEAAEAILLRIAEAEAALHGVPLSEVHFHEIADWDALMDVTAAGSLIAAFPGAGWSVSPLPLGGGLVNTAHGLLPSPAPATAKILTGYEWRNDGVSGERVTPTGAAIIAHITGGRGNGRNPGGRLTATGYGAGMRELEGVANILRVTLYEGEEGAGDMITAISFDIDDMTGEEIATAAERLRAAPGLRDLVLIPAQGKKGRPVMRFEILAEPAAADRLAARIFDETSTIGLRRADLRRDLLPRAGGEAAGLRVKRVTRPGGETAKAEADDLTGFESLARRRAAARKAEG